MTGLVLGYCRALQRLPGDRQVFFCGGVVSKGLLQPRVCREGRLAERHVKNIAAGRAKPADFFIGREGWRDATRDAMTRFLPHRPVSTNKRFA